MLPVRSDTRGLPTMPNALSTGSQLRMLNAHGHSTESAPAVSLHPEFGLNVAKHYHPDGITTPEGIVAKEALGRVQHPANVRLLGKSIAPGTNMPIHHYEYVDGTTIHDLKNQGRWTPADEAHKRAVLEDLRKKAYEQGVVISDTHDRNVMLEHGTRQIKLIDSLPVLRAPEGEPQKTWREVYRMPPEGPAKQIPTSDFLNPNGGVLDRIRNYDFEDPANRPGQVRRGSPTNLRNGRR